MSDHMAAEILIGGAIRRSQAAKLCQAIAAQYVSLEWGESPFMPETAEDLLAARREIEDALVLWLCDDQARWGEFDELEAFLKKHRIAYRRYGDGKYEYDCERVEYRPGHPLTSTVTNKEQQPVVVLSIVCAAEAVMQQAADQLGDGNPDAACRRLQKGLQTLRKELPVELPPLTSLEIV